MRKFYLASDSRLVSSTLLFRERNQQAMFLLQKLFENELLYSMLIISKTPIGQLHAHVINTTNAIYCYGFISQAR